LLSSALCAGIILAPATARAHPLGNFTINTSAGIVVRPDEVVVEYLVDMAEIPAFEERTRIDRDADGQVSEVESDAYGARTCGDLAAGLSLSVDGRAAPLATRSSGLAFPPGQAGLRTLRLTCVLAVPADDAPLHRISFEDANFADRVGWREVTAVADGATLVRSDVPAESASGRLQTYPEGAAPLHVTTALVSFRPGGPSLDRHRGDVAGLSSSGGVLGTLAARREIGAAGLAVMVLAAIAVGALHALGPGHGKTLVGAYLVGAGGGLRDAIAVGAAVSVMHTASVLGLGLLVLSAEQVLSPERVYPWLGLAAGLVALALGTWLLVARLHALADERRHGHAHPHPVQPLSKRGLVALAFSGGILPSPSALVVLLGSISLGRSTLGLLLIASFSLGLAGSLVAVGALAVRARHVADGRLPASVIRIAPVLSAGCIAAMGVVLTARAVAGI
jgi:ABC-type nickel/cobalt efflux system permease component RcnA